MFNLVIWVGTHIIMISKKRSMHFKSLGNGKRKCNGMDWNWIPWTDFISGQMNSQKYINLIDEQLEQYAAQITKKNWIFQQDRPCRFLDLNIIENVSSVQSYCLTDFCFCLHLFLRKQPMVCLCIMGYTMNNICKMNKYAYVFRKW